MFRSFEVGHHKWQSIMLIFGVTKAKTRVHLGIVQCARVKNL